MLRQEMFLTNIESLMPGLQNLWSEVKLFLLSAETLPVLLISKAVTVVWMCVMSVCLFVCLVNVPLWNVHIKGHCELKYVEFVVFFFPYGDVRFEIGHNDLRGHSTSPRRLMSLYVTEYCVLCGVRDFPGLRASNFPFPSLPVAFSNSRSLPVKRECDFQFPFPFPGVKKPFPLTPGE